VTIFFEVVADTLIVGGLGSRGEVRRLSGMKFTSEAQASGRGVGVDVGVAGGIDVGGGVGVGVGSTKAQKVMVTGAGALVVVPSPSCPFVFAPQHLALHVPIYAQV
jgi:hypothetical protein